MVECNDEVDHKEILKCTNKDLVLDSDRYFDGVGARGGVVLKALVYKPEGRGFHSRWCHWNFSVT
jgi:hypothetical protein